MVFTCSIILFVVLLGRSCVNASDLDRYRGVRMPRQVTDSSKNTSCCSAYSGCINNNFDSLQSPDRYECLESLKLPCSQVTWGTDCTTMKTCGKFLQGPYDNGLVFGTIESYYYPYQYNNNLDCSWHIQVRTGGRVQLRFKAFQLESLAGTDYLMVFDGPTEQDRMFDSYYGYIAAGFKLTSTGNSMYLIFHTDRTTTDIGFRITYQELGVCMPTQLACGFGELDCYEMQDKCNNVWDCPLHGGDEYMCYTCMSASRPYACSSLLANECYQLEDRCDGNSSCSNGADNLHCVAEQCGPHNGTFLCQFEGKCIYEYLVCNGVNDCLDYSDEQHCYSWSRGAVLACFHSITLSCLILLVGGGLSYRIYNKVSSRRRERRHSRRINQARLAPITEIQQEILARRSAPPQYDVAMETSRPFNEVVRQETRQQSNSNSNNIDSNNDGAQSNGIPLPAYSDILSASANVHAFLSWDPSGSAADMEGTGGELSYVVIEDGGLSAAWNRQQLSQAGDSDERQQQRSSNSPTSRNAADDTVSVDLMDVDAPLAAVNWGSALDTRGSAADSGLGSEKESAVEATSRSGEGRWSWEVSEPSCSVPRVADFLLTATSDGERLGDSGVSTDCGVTHSDEVLSLL